MSGIISCNVWSGQRKKLAKFHLLGETSLCHSPLIGLAMLHINCSFSLVRRPNCAKYGSDIIKQRSFIAAIFGEFIYAVVSQIACTFNGQQRKVESDYSWSQQKYPNEIGKQVGAKRKFNHKITSP
jgi:hypothetical protein